MARAPGRGTKVPGRDGERHSCAERRLARLIMCEAAGLAKGHASLAACDKGREVKRRSPGTSWTWRPGRREPDER
jgi:hypothetical protein